MSQMQTMVDFPLPHHYMCAVPASSCFPSFPNHQRSHLDLCLAKFKIRQKKRGHFPDQSKVIPKLLILATKRMRKSNYKFQMRGWGRVAREERSRYTSRSDGTTLMILMTWHSVFIWSNGWVTGTNDMMARLYLSIATEHWAFCV